MCLGLRSMPTNGNALVSVRRSSVKFAHDSMSEAPLVQNDAGCGVCICDGHGNCFGCEKLPAESIFKN